MKIVIVAALALLLTGCGGEDSDGNRTPRWIAPHYVEFDGVRVLCVFEKAGYAGGVSCDWEGAQR